MTRAICAECDESGGHHELACSQHDTAACAVCSEDARERTTGVRREFRRILLSDLPEWEVAGWRPAQTAPCGAVGADAWCAGTLATVLVVRDAPRGNS